MFLHLLSYYQTIPAILDLIFPFGDQDYAIDSSFGGFRSQTSIDTQDHASCIKQLGRSGLAF